MTKSELALRLIEILGDSSIAFLEIDGDVYIHDHSIVVKKNEALFRQPVTIVSTSVHTHDQRVKLRDVLSEYIA